MKIIRRFFFATFLIPCPVAFFMDAGASTCRADMLYTVRGNSNSINVIDTTTTAESTFVSTQPPDLIHYALAFDGSSNLYTNNQQNDILKITSAGVATTLANVPGANYGLAVGPSGDIFASIDGYSAASRLASIDRITPGGVVSTLATLTGPTGGAIAFDASGNLFAVDNSGQSIEKITPGGLVSTIYTPGSSPIEALAVDSAGNLFAAVSHNGQTYNVLGSIVEIAPDGSISTFAPSAFYSVGGMAFDSTGNLFVAERDNPFHQNIDAIVKFAPDGSSSTFLDHSSLPAAGPLAFGPRAVPEPSTLSLLGIGGVLGLLIVRRRRTAIHNTLRTNGVS